MLKVKFIRIKNVVTAEILEQGDEIKRGAFSLEQEGYRMASLDSPSLGEHTLYLRGEDSQYDSLLSSWSYNSIKDAKAAVQGFSTLIKRHNDSIRAEGLEKYIEVTVAE